MIKPAGSKYIKDQRHSYFMYTIQHRAIPAITDGLKPSGRRTLWMGRNGDKYKTATLAGLTMPIHPHSLADDAINTLAAPFGNNIPLFTGIGAFGTMVAPNSYGASRYTSVKVSDFTKDVVFKDIDIIPMIPNYDDTLEEPLHFLPLIPIALLNPTFGIAGGFSCNILPRSLRDIVTEQIKYLEKGENAKIEDKLPTFTPLNTTAVDRFEDTKSGNMRFVFHGEFERVNSSTIKITKLPYGTVHSKFIEKMTKLEENYSIANCDDLSKDVINIVIKTSRGQVDTMSDADILKFLELTHTESEIMNLTDFYQTSIVSTSFPAVIKTFTNWRLGYYKNRYENLLRLIDIDIQRYIDIITAIKFNIGGIAKKTLHRSNLTDFLIEIGVVHTDYISALPIYRLTDEERLKTEAKLQEAQVTRNDYLNILSSDERRSKIYISELKDVLKNYG
jgi:DNA gyrase/topoisomerase IV subunit A